MKNKGKVCFYLTRVSSEVRRRMIPAFITRMFFRSTPTEERASTNLTPITVWSVFLMLWAFLGDCALNCASNTLDVRRLITHGLLWPAIAHVTQRSAIQILGRRRSVTRRKKECGVRRSNLYGEHAVQGIFWHLETRFVVEWAEKHTWETLIFLLTMRHENHCIAQPLSIG